VNIYTFSKFLKYKLFSSHRKGHGIHSPFVFNLITKIFRNKITSPVVLRIEELRNKMLSDHRVIRVTDYGSGSQILRSNLREIYKLVKYSSIPAKYGRLLANLSAEFGRGEVIELGTSLGISASYLASISGETTIHTIEGCQETAKIAQDNFRTLKLDNIKLYKGTFDDMLSVLEDKKIHPGLVFIDGDHSKESVLRYFYRIVDMSDNETVIVLDDIHYSKEMGEAWAMIKQYEKVSLSIDIFRMGVIFFRSGLTHDDIIIRY